MILHLQKSAHLRLSIVLIALTLFMSGCSYVQVVVHSSTESQLLRDGEKAFKVGNYQKAENLFEKVYSSDTDRQTKNTALYNLICTRMILAENVRDITSAISLFKSWEKSYPSGIYTENPVFIIAALQRSRTLILQELDQAEFFKEKMKKSKQAQTRIRESYKGQKKIVEDLTAQLQILEETAMEYRNQIEKLQHQIKELEEIDQKLQEKKKPL